MAVPQDVLQDVPTRETTAFLAAHLRSGATVLEVGCGEGQVAAFLRARGYRVIGIESDRDRALATSRLGVPCVLAAWPCFESAAVDAIAFTRSLHHIEPLRESVGKARALLVPEFYRYLVYVLPANREAASFLRNAFAEESASIAKGELSALGRRIVASPR